MHAYHLPSVEEKRSPANVHVKHEADQVFKGYDSQINLVSCYIVFLNGSTEIDRQRSPSWACNSGRVLHEASSCCGTSLSEPGIGKSCPVHNLLQLFIRRHRTDLHTGESAKRPLALERERSTLHVEYVPYRTLCRYLTFGIWTF
jgi:hypothetical protein